MESVQTQTKLIKKKENLFEGGEIHSSPGIFEVEKSRC